MRASTRDQREAVSALLADEAVDALLVVHIGLSGGRDDDPVRRMAELEAAVAGASKPVVACVVGPNGELPEREERVVPNYRFPEAAGRVLSIAADRRDWLGRRLGQAPSLEGFGAAAARAVRRPRARAGRTMSRRGRCWRQPGSQSAPRARWRAARSRWRRSLAP